MEDIEEKQAFLGREIKDKNYDTDLFIKYLEENTEKGLELERWTMQELEEVVKTFQEEHGIEQNNEDEENNFNLLNQDVNNSNQELLTNEVKVENNTGENDVGNKDNNIKEDEEEKENNNNKVNDNFDNNNSVNNNINNNVNNKNITKKENLDGFEVVNLEDFPNMEKKEVQCKIQDKGRLTNLQDLKARLSE